MRARASRRYLLASEGVDRCPGGEGGAAVVDFAPKWRRAPPKRVQRRTVRVCSQVANVDGPGGPLVNDETMLQQGCTRQELLTSRLGRLVALGGDLSSLVSGDDAVEVLLRYGLADLGANGAAIALWDSDGLQVAATAGYASEVLGARLRIPGDAQVPIAVAARDRVLVWVESRADAAARFPRALDAAPGAQAWAAVPLVVDGVVIGSFGATFPEPCPFAREQRHFYIAVASLTAAWCGAHLAGSTRPKDGPLETGSRQPEELLDRLALVTRALTARMPPYEVLTIALQQAMAATGAEGGTVALVHRDGTIAPEITLGYAVDMLPAFEPLTLDRLLPMTAAAVTGEPVWVESRADAKFRFPALLDVDTPSEAWAALPLIDEGDTFAVLGISFKAPHVFAAAERGFLKALSQLVALRLQMY